MRVAPSLAALVALSASSCSTSLTPPRPEPPGCQVQADGRTILCGGRVAATLGCTKWNYGACNVLVLSYADGETVILHALHGDAKFDKVYDVALSSTGNRIWFTESDLSTWAMLFSRNGGMSHRSRVYDVWSGKLRDEGSGAVAGSVPAAFEPTPPDDSGAKLYKALREGTQVEVTYDNNGLPVFVAPKEDGKP